MSMFNLFKKSEKDIEKEREILKAQQNKQYYQDEKVELPENFAQNVMELEMHLQFIETYSMEVVQQLNQLYRMAVQFYINEDPRKASHFQKKLATLLTHPHTLQLIENKPIPAKGTSVDQSQYTSHLRMELNKFNTQSDVVVRSILEGSQRKLQKNNRMLSANIQSQEDKLKRRLQQRSRSKHKLQ